MTIKYPWFDPLTLRTYNYLFAIASGRGEQDEVRQVRSRNKILKILFLESGKNQERFFLQIFLNMSRIKKNNYQDPISRRNRDILRSSSS